MSDLEIWTWDRLRRSRESKTSIAGLMLVVLAARRKAAEEEKAKG